MTQDDELILSQAREIFMLRQQVNGLIEDRKAIHRELYCIGGPLNDNKLQYSKEQLGPFGRISRYVED